MILHKPSAKFITLFLLSLLFTVQAAHLPAVRRRHFLVPAPKRRQLPGPSDENEQERDMRSWTRMDSKRLLASRLLRNADRHKERSLRDVLIEHDDGISLRSKPHKNASEKNINPRVEPDVKVHVEETEAYISMSQLFAWAINSTVRSAAKSYTRRATPASPREALPSTATRTVQQNIRKRKDTDPDALDVTVDLQQMETLRTSTESEFEAMKRSVHTLSSKHSIARQVSALLLLEELCHSIDNGRDLEISGGLNPIISAMQSNHATVRANAAWALATCCQNNPPVQKGALDLEAVPILTRLAAHDGSSVVRARALFALNALLELEEARIRFEELALAVQVVRNSMAETDDFRATRRALNLTELLVRRNLDAWKTMLEAWDIPAMIENVMREHPDRDVRESAARTIAALDGRPVA